MFYSERGTNNLRFGRGSPISGQEILFENTLWYTEHNFKKAGYADYNNYTNTFSLQSFHKVDLLHLKNA